MLLKIVPAGAGRNEESVMKIGILAVVLLGRVLHHLLFNLAANEVVVLCLEDIGAALQEQQSEVIVLVGGRSMPSRRRMSAAA